LLLLFLKLSEKIWLKDDCCWVADSERSSASSWSSSLSEMTLIVNYKFLIGCLLKSKTSKKSFLVLNNWYYPFDCFILKSTFKDRESCDIYDVAKFFHFSKLKNDCIELGEYFLASLSLVDSYISSNSCWSVWAEVKNLDLFNKILIWKMFVIVSIFSFLSYSIIDIKTFTSATKDGLCNFSF